MKRFVGLFLAYAAVFLLLAYPSWLSGVSSFLGDQGDGLQNLWDVWWVKHALFDLHTNPLFSRLVFAPAGTSFLAYTISLTNTLPSAVLALGMGPLLAYNLWLVLGFVFGGIATAYLFLEVGSGLLGAFVAGCFFTFSEYHFAHAQGHFQLIGVQWLPLFLWAWLRLLDRPGAWRAAGAAATFLLVFFADYYYAAYAVIAGAVAVAFRWRDWRRLWLPLGLFTAILLVTVGPLAWETSKFLHTDLTGTHEASEYGADLLAPFVPGAYWRFAPLSRPVWSSFAAPAVEGSGYLGWAALVLAAIGIARKRTWKEWFLMSTGALFLALSFGPLMRVDGVMIRGIWGPYHHFERLFPLIGLGGVPGRMGVIAVLCLAVLAGLGAEALKQNRQGIWLAVLLGAGLVELAPAALPRTELPTTGIFQKMRELPQGYGVLDVSPEPVRPWKRFFQMFHQMPASSGLNARFSRAVVSSEAAIVQRAQQGDWDHLCKDAGFRWVLLRSGDPAAGRLANQAPILEGDGYRVFDLGECARQP